MNAAATIESAAPCPAAVREARMWLQRGYLAEFAERLRSYGVSIGEGCSRGENNLTIMHVRQARLIMIDMLAVVKTLEALDADLPAAGNGGAA
jgi:hypothetical protein